jgi:MmyB-like transcription regulator ligand binding domain
VRSNAYRLALHPEGMAPRIGNFPEWARHVVNNIAAALARNPDDRLSALHAELSSYVPPTRPAAGHLGFAVPLQLSTSRGELCPSRSPLPATTTAAGSAVRPGSGLTS